MSVIDSPAFLEAVLLEGHGNFRMENLQFSVSPTAVHIVAPIDHPKAEYLIVLARDVVQGGEEVDPRVTRILEHYDIHKGTIEVTARLEDTYT